jgi:hypothetical protein
MNARAAFLVSLSAVLAMVAVAVPKPARADSIYLKNGRVIHSEDARVEGDKVVFVLHGGEQSIPLAVVDRVEHDDWRAPGGASSATAADESAPVVSPADSAAALQQLGSMLNQGNGPVDAAQALQLLQGLGAAQGNPSAGGMESLAPLLGILGGAGGDGAGGLGALSGDLDKVMEVLPALSRLGAALFAPEYSTQAAQAAAADVIASLERLGVSRSEIRQRAQQLGVPPEVLERIR